MQILHITGVSGFHKASASNLDFPSDFDQGQWHFQGAHFRLGLLVYWSLRKSTALLNSTP